MLAIRIYLGRALALLVVPVSGYPLWQLASYIGSLQTDNLLVALGNWLLSFISVLLLIIGPVALSMGLHALITPGEDEVEEYFKESEKVKVETSEKNKHPVYPLDLSQVEEEMEKTVRITRVAQEQVAESYANITREVSAFLLATEKLENRVGDMSLKDRRELHTARLAYLTNLAEGFREGQRIIREYLKHSLSDRERS